MRSRYSCQPGTTASTSFPPSLACIVVTCTTRVSESQLGAARQVGLGEELTGIIFTAGLEVLRPVLTAADEGTSEHCFALEEVRARRHLPRLLRRTGDIAAMETSEAEGLKVLS